MIERWTIDTPQMLISVQIKRFKDKTRGQTVSNARLDNIVWPEMSAQAPNRANKASITVIPSSDETLRPRSYTLISSS